MTSIDAHPLRHAPGRDEIERILTRRLTERRLDGFTLETSLEILSALATPPATRSEEDTTAIMVEMANRRSEEEIRREASNARKAAAFDNLKELCGYFQDGSEEMLKLSPDDATRTWTVTVGRTSEYGGSIEEALAAAIRARAGKPATAGEVR